ncbi:MAG TPA: hypothetical protein VLK84_08770 [Longimicrobium sp.]|nr:hypothetical protein [Longimicrobium sp.]
MDDNVWTTTGWRLRAVLVAITICACGEPSAEQSEAERLTAVPLARSASDIEFSRITDITVDSRGQIYVGDLFGQIVVVGGDGRMSRRLGRTGAGPGEYQSIGTVHALAADSLYVYDGYAQRVTVYAPHSDRVAYTTRLSQPDYSFPMDVEPLGASSMIGHFRRINGDVPIAGQQRDDVIRLLGRDGSVVRDTVITVTEPDVVEVHTATGQGYFLPQFARQTLVRWGSDTRIYSLWTDSARVHIHDTQGRPQGSFAVELGVSRLPLLATTIDSVAQANAAAGLTRKALSDAFHARWQTWPLVQDMLVDDQSRIWILPVTHAPQVNWLAFDARGKQLASVQLPRSVRPRLIRGDRMYAVSRDSLDVESLVVYRLAPSSTRTPEGS